MDRQCVKGVKSKTGHQIGSNIHVRLTIHAGLLHYAVTLLCLITFIDTMWLECVQASDPIRFTSFSCRIRPVDVMVKTA